MRASVQASGRIKLSPRLFTNNSSTILGYKVNHPDDLFAYAHQFRSIL